MIKLEEPSASFLDGFTELLIFTQEPKILGLQSKPKVDTSGRRKTVKPNKLDFHLMDSSLRSDSSNSNSGISSNQHSAHNIQSAHSILSAHSGQSNLTSLFPDVNIKTQQQIKIDQKFKQFHALLYSSTSQDSKPLDRMPSKSENILVKNSNSQSLVILPPKSSPKLKFTEISNRLDNFERIPLSNSPSFAETKSRISNFPVKTYSFYQNKQIRDVNQNNFEPNSLFQAKQIRKINHFDQNKH